MLNLRRSSLSVSLLLTTCVVVAACDACKTDSNRGKDSKAADAGSSKTTDATGTGADAGAAVGEPPPGPVLTGPPRPERKPGALDPLLDEAARLAKLASSGASPGGDDEIKEFAASVKKILDKAGAKAKRTDLAAIPAGASLTKRASDTAEIVDAVGFVRDGVVTKVTNGVLVAEGSVSVGAATDAVIVASDVAFVGACESCIVIAGGRVDVKTVSRAKKSGASVILSGGDLSIAEVADALVGAGDNSTLLKEADASAVAKLANEPDLVLQSRRTLATIEADVSSTTPEEGEAVVRSKGGRSGRKTLLGKAPMTRKGPIPGTEGWVLAQVTDKIVAFRNGDAFAIVPVVPIDRSMPPGMKPPKDGDEEE